MAKEDYELAGLGSRFVALLIDGLLLGAISIPFILLIAFASVPSTRFSGLVGFAGTFWLFMLCFGALQYLYFIILEGLGGQTVGKIVMGIKVVGYDGKPIGMARSFVRNILRMVDGLFFYVIGIILIVSTEKKQRLGDIAANSIVINIGEKKTFVPEKNA